LQTEKNKGEQIEPQKKNGGLIQSKLELQMDSAFVPGLFNRSFGSWMNKAFNFNFQFLSQFLFFSQL
jgi:hypothetical protein